MFNQDINIDKRKTPEYRMKCSLRQMGKKPCLGKHWKHSEETKEKMRETHSKNLKKLWSNESYRLMQSNARKGRTAWNYIDGRSKGITTARYGDDWDKIRFSVYLRDSFKCQDCGIKNKKLDVHHIIPFLQSHDNSMENLVSLCRGCHAKRDSNLLKKHKESDLFCLTRI